MPSAKALTKLSFWRRSSTKEAAVVAFEAPAEDPAGEEEEMKKQAELVPPPDADGSPRLLAARISPRFGTDLVKAVRQPRPRLGTPTPVSPAKPQVRAEAAAEPAAAGPAAVHVGGEEEEGGAEKLPVAAGAEADAAGSPNRRRLAAPRAQERAASLPQAEAGVASAASNAAASAGGGFGGSAARPAPPPLPPVRLPTVAEKAAVEEEATSPVDQEALRFGASLDQVSATVGEVFGDMIGASFKSSKWDKRSQALKAIGTVLRGLSGQGLSAPGSTGPLGKGLRLRDRLRCWHTCCQLLHHLMRDKVLPVCLATHDLFIDAFAFAEGLVCEEDVRFALSILIEHLIDRLGDSNLRLHQSARKCVLFCAEQPGLLCLSDVLGRLRKRLAASGKERTKVHFGVLDTVNFLLQHFPGRRGQDDDEADSAGSWTQHDVAPFVLAGLQDDALGPRVRTAAASLAVTVHQTFGMQAVQPILDGLRPAKQALLAQKFHEAEEDGGGPHEAAIVAKSAAMAHAPRSEDLAGLVVRGRGAVRRSPVPLLPGAVAQEFDEESLMDGILEEAGAVFSQDSGIFSQDLHSTSASLASKSQCGWAPTWRDAGAAEGGVCCEDPRTVEQLMLQEELLSMGFEIQDICEQEELLSMGFEIQDITEQEERGGRGAARAPPSSAVGAQLISPISAMSVSDRAVEVC